jgi:hypothetical protein
MRCDATPSQIYPLVTIKRRTRRANRVVYEKHHGVKLKQNQWVLHHCDNTRCVEPLHLFLGTPASNMADKVRKGRQAKGQKVRRDALSEDAVRAIFADTRVHHAIAAEHGVWRSTVSYIKSGKTWRHVTGL